MIDVFLWVDRSRSERLIPQTMQQIIRTLKRVCDAKGFLENRHNIPASKGTVGLCQHVEKVRLLIAWQFCRLTGLFFDGHPGEAVVPIGIDPCLNEGPATIDALANLRFGHALQRQQHHAQTIALFGIAFASIQYFEGFQIICTVKRNIHRGILSVGDIAKRIMPQSRRSRNPNRRLTRPGIILYAYN